MEFVGARGFWAVILVAAAAAIPAARGVYMDLPSTGSKCVSEELHNNVVVMGDYYAFIGEDYDVNNTANPTITIKITSPYGNTIHHKEKVMHGEFAFTTTEVGNYMACFSLDGGDHHGKRVNVGIEWKTGIAAKDYNSVAKKEKIEGLELELKKLEDRVESIHETMGYMMTREVEMREVSEKTNGRVARYSLMSLGLCIVVSVTQSLYLRRYFQRKKLI